MMCSYWLALSVLSAAPAWTDTFDALGPPWTVDASAGSRVWAEGGVLHVAGPENHYAHIQRVLGEDLVTVSALVKPGVPAAISWGCGVFLYWAPGVWCELSVVDHGGGVYYTAEQLFPGRAPVETQLRQADRNEWQWLRIELGADCIRYCARPRRASHWAELRVVERPPSCAGPPKLLIVGKGFGQGEGSAYPEPDLDNDYAAPGPGCESLVDSVVFEPTPTSRLHLGPGEGAWPGDKPGEKILAMPGDPTFDQVSSVYPPMRYPREAVGPKDHPNEIGIGPSGELELGTGVGRWLIGTDSRQFGVDPQCGRQLLHGYLPIVTTTWESAGVKYEQTVVGWSRGMTATGPLIGYVRLSAEWTSGPKAVPVRFVIGGEGAVTVENVLTPSPEGRAAVYLRVPYQVSRDARPAWVDENEFAGALLSAKEWWERELARGMRVSLPDERLMNAYRAWLAWNYIDVDMVDGLPEPHDGSGFYEAVFGYSAARYAWALDLWGRHDDAARYLATLVAHQDDEGLLSWNFGLTDTGTLLLAIAEHYRLTRDADWLRSVEPKALKACEWLARHAEESRRANRGQVTEGLIRFRSYCDYPEPVFSYFHNCFCCAGMERFAGVLRDVGDHGQAERVASEAARYRRDIERSMGRSALTLKGLRTIPMEPDTHRLLKDGGYTSGAYYGLVASTMLECGFLDPTGETGGDLAEFLRRGGGITMGTSSFPPGIDHAYCYGYMLTQLERGERERYLLGFWAALAYGMSRDTYAGVEVTNLFTGENAMTLPHLYSGSQQLFMLRTLLVREQGGKLVLCDATPRAWLQSGKRIEVTGAPTEFGDVSFVVESRADQGEIRAIIDPPMARTPSAIVLRLRHPTAKPLASVRVNGVPWPDHDDEAIALPTGWGRLKVTARYR